jgi:hypothetical protein
MIKCSSFGKEEREKQKWAQDKGICDSVRSKWLEEG